MIRTSGFPRVPPHNIRRNVVRSTSFPVFFFERGVNFTPLPQLAFHPPQSPHYSNRVHTRARVNLHKTRAWNAAAKRYPPGKPQSTRVRFKRSAATAVDPGPGPRGTTGTRFRVVGSIVIAAQDRSRSDRLEAVLATIIVHDRR